jgi:ABC-type nickel/cobalt efflux system permease component RcnA
MFQQVQAIQTQISAPIATVISAIISVLLGIWVAYANRKTQRVIQKATESQAKSIEELKHQLAVEASKQGKLYEKRLDVIREMYKHLVEVNGHMKYMVSGKMFHEGQDKEKIKKRS